MVDLNLLAPALWQSLALCMARWLGFSLFVPLFGRRHMGAMHRNAICLALALPQVPSVYAQMVAGQWHGYWLVYLGIKEVALGVLLGIFVAIPFWALRGALTLVDNQRGANAAQMANPSLEADSSILGEFGERLLLVWLAETGVFVIAFELMVDAGTIWPVLQAWPLSVPSDGSSLWTALSGLMTKTLQFSAPVLLLLLVIEFAMALASTSVKGIDVYQIVMPIKSLIAMLFLAFAGYFLFNRVVNEIIHWWGYGIGLTFGWR